MSNRIWLSPPHMGGKELEFIQDAFAANWISPAGPHLQAFEKELAAYCGVAHCAALSSGTAAIHLALIILGIGKGDEVICSSFTFSASANPIVYVGATPVFVDSEQVTWNMDPELLREAITDRIRQTGKKPKAIILVHLYGMPAQVDEILAISREFDIPLIEDAAEALGSEYKGKKVGTFGDFGVFSFNGNKIITTSGGGALVSQSGDWIEKARFLATQAREKALHYEHREIGYNYRLSNISAGIGRGQLQVLNNHISNRRRNFEFYRSRLGGKGVLFLPEPDFAFANRWLTTMCVENTREPVSGLVERLEAQNIEARPLWKPMHLQPVFAPFPSYKNGVSERLFNEGICLPSGSRMSDTDLDRVAAVVEDWLTTGKR